MAQIEIPTIDPFKNFTKEQIEALMPYDSAKRSRTQRETLSKLTPEQLKARMENSCCNEVAQRKVRETQASRSEEEQRLINKKRSDYVRAYHANLSGEERAKRGSKISETFRLKRDGSLLEMEEGLKLLEEWSRNGKEDRGRGFRTWREGKTFEELSEIEDRRIDSIRRYHANLTPEQTRKRLEGNILSPEAQAKCKEVIKNRPFREKEEIYSRVSESIKELWKQGRYTAERNEKISGSQNRYYASLTDEEREVRAELSRLNFAKGTERIKEILSDPAKKLEWVRQSFRNQAKPSMPEVFLGIFLDGKYLGEWAYNGGGKQGIAVGGRIPDYVNTDGWKAVIEELGTYWHPIDDDGNMVAHYNKYGYDCLSIWEYDCYDWVELDRKLEEFYKKREVK